MSLRPTQMTTENARQGDTGHGVRYVLGFSMLFAVLAMIGVLFFAT